MGPATRTFAAVFGTLAALAGIEHGLGEVLQGSVRPAGLVIESWPDSAFFRIQSGEPALTVVPDLLAAGILSILVSCAVLAWAVTGVQRRRGGLVLIGLSAVLLLVGGGFGPPLLGVLVGLAAELGGAPLAARRARAARRLASGRAAALLPPLVALWPAALATCLATWLLLLPGIPMLSYFWGVESAALVVAVICMAFGLLVVTAALGLARDAWDGAEAASGARVWTDRAGTWLGAETHKA